MPLAEPRTEPEAVSEHERHKRLARTRPDAPLLMLGDSHIAGWEHPRRGLVPLWLHLRRYRPLVCGVGGDRVAHLRWRVEDGLLDGLAPRVTLVEIGTNQMARAIPAEQTVEEIRALVDLLRERLPSTRVLLCGVIPTDPWEWPVPPKTQAINAELSRTPGVTFHDPAPALMRGDTIRAEYYSPDRVHLNPRGYHAWGRTLAPVLRALIRSV